MPKSDKKVLIVEDDKDFLWILRQGFDNQDFTVFYALDGEEGLSLAKKEKPDLIIVDILLPNMDGIDMVKKIKDLGLTSQIIYLTNFKDPEHVSRALDAAMGSDYIVKSDMHMDAVLKRVKDKIGLT